MIKKSPLRQTFHWARGHWSTCCRSQKQQCSRPSWYLWGFFWHIFNLHDIVILCPCKVFINNKSCHWLQRKRWWCQCWWWCQPSWQQCQWVSGAGQDLDHGSPILIAEHRLGWTPGDYLLYSWILFYYHRLLRSYLDTLVVRIAHKDPSIIENNNTLEVVDIIIFTAIITIDVTMIIISTCGLVNSPFPRPRLPTARIKSSSIVFLLEPRLVHDLQW